MCSYVHKCDPAEANLDKLNDVLPNIHIFFIILQQPKVPNKTKISQQYQLAFSKATSKTKETSCYEK